MAHEITKSDHVVLHKNAAWHGLGTVVEKAPNAREALKLAKLNWQVEQTAGVSGTYEAGKGLNRSTVRIVTDSHVINYRSDTKEVLGVVGSKYVPVQNDELADFIDALVKASGGGKDRVCKIESAGSIRGGKRVWFLVKGESFNVGPRKGLGKDQMCTYLLVANGHDGSLALTVQPTSIRVVCSNTLHMSLGARQSKADKAMTVRFLHRGDMASKLEEAKRVLGLLDDSTAAFKKSITALSARKMTREQLQAFWLEVYAAAEGEIPMKPENAAQQMSLNRARATLQTWARNFDNERAIAGETAWNALNAVTHWYDHQRLPKQSADARTQSKLWGTGTERKAIAFNKAMALVKA